MTKDYLSEFDKWIALLPEEQLEQEIRELEAQVDGLRLEVAKRQAALDLKRRFSDDREQSPPTSDDRGADAHPMGVESSDMQPMGKRAAVRELLRQDPDREWSYTDLRDALITRRWLPQSDSAQHTLRVTLSHLRKRGEIESPRRGVYRLAQQEKEWS